MLPTVKERILEALEELGDITAAMLTSGASSKRLYATLSGRRREERLKNALARMSRAAEVEIRTAGDEEIVAITEKGRKRLARLRFEDLKLKRRTNWDGKWRVVIFDIPERFKQARHALQGKMLEIGFYRLQDSVYIFPDSCQDEIYFISELFGIRRFVFYMEVLYLDNDKAVKKHFVLH